MLCTEKVSERERQNCPAKQVGVTFIEVGLLEEDQKQQLSGPLLHFFCSITDGPLRVQSYIPLIFRAGNLRIFRTSKSSVFSVPPVIHLLLQMIFCTLGHLRCIQSHHSCNTIYSHHFLSKSLYKNAWNVRNQFYSDNLKKILIHYLSQWRNLL